MIFREDLGTGYMYCYEPSHYCANGAGKVMEHTYVMSEFIGRKLHPNEVVHHKDRNKKNNDISNLVLMSREDHALLHALEDQGLEYVNQVCGSCDIPFVISKKSDRIYCSVACSRKASVKFEISKEDLEILIWKHPTTEVARLFGVSDSAIAKRCKKYGINKPPRGYWAKLASIQTRA